MAIAYVIFGVMSGLLAAVICAITGGSFGLVALSYMLGGFAGVCALIVFVLARGVTNRFARPRDSHGKLGRSGSS